MPDQQLQSFTGMSSAVTIIILVIAILVTLLTVIIWWRIFSKAGYPGALSLIFVFIPFGALILLFVLAFGDWPILRELDALRQQSMMRQPYAGGPMYPGQGGPQYPSDPPYPPNPSGPQYPQYR